MVDLETFNKLKEQQSKAKAIKNEDLFTVNVDKTGLKTKRARLAKDRFKSKERPTSKYEQDMVRKME